ncbi:hypothetical protein RBY4I_242 [Rhodobacterales bacterium Y4I]|nr:hypothetical protein RBY4I_242 [Rhodobacterales bacterium Y4I]
MAKKTPLRQPFSAFHQAFPAPGAPDFSSKTKPNLQRCKKGHN